MNFVKIIAKSQMIDLRLFVKEADCYTALKAIQDAHNNAPTRQFWSSHESDILQVNMRRVRIADDKARLTKTNRLTRIVNKSFDQLTALKEQFKKTA